MIRTSFVAALLLAGSTAVAGPFVHIQRFDGESRAGVDMGYGSIDGATDDVTLLRFDLHGHYVDPGSHFGGYFQVPYAYASGNDDSESAIGDAEIGGIFIPAGLTTADHSLILHAGITLPTAPDELGPALIGAYASVLRVHDLYQAVPKGVSVRFGASPTFRSGNIYARADIGFDVNMDAAGDDTADPAMHVNAGVGVYVTPEASVTAEVASITVFDDTEGDDDNLINGGISFRYNAGAVAPYLGVMVPFDDDVRDDLSFAIIVGAEARL